MARVRVPHADLARRRERDELVADEEQKLHPHLEIERPDDVGLRTVFSDTPQLDFRSIANRHHPQRRFVRRGQVHLRVYRDPLDNLVNEGRGEDELPPGRVLHPVADEEVRVRNSQPVVVGLDDLDPQRVDPSLVLLDLTENQAQVVFDELVEICR